MSRCLYLRQIHILAEIRACKIRYKTVHYIVYRIVLPLERFPILYQFFHACRFAGQRSQSSHFTLNCIPTSLKNVSRGLNQRQIQILAEFAACKTVHYTVYMIVILLERFAILYQFFTPGGCHSKSQESPHFSLNCLPTPLTIVLRGGTILVWSRFTLSVKIKERKISYRSKCPHLSLNCISTSLALVLSGLNRIESHALSNIISVQTEVQNCQFYSSE